MKRFWIYLALASVSITACKTSPLSKTHEKTWQEQVADIDVEIQELIVKDQEYRQQVNEQERKALIYMRDDWSTYSKKIQEMEKDRQFALDIEQRIQALRERKQKILDAHKGELENKS